MENDTKLVANQKTLRAMDDLIPSMETIEELFGIGYESFFTKYNIEKMDNEKHGIMIIYLMMTEVNPHNIGQFYTETGKLTEFTVSDLKRVYNSAMEKWDPNGDWLGIDTILDKYFEKPASERMGEILVEMAHSTNGLISPQFMKVNKEHYLKRLGHYDLRGVITQYVGTSSKEEQIKIIWNAFKLHKPLSLENE